MKSDKPAEALSSARTAMRDQRQKESPSVTPKTRPRGKMYWKFATLEGWRAPTDQQAAPREDESD
ncbi:MAG: hypothetical protein EBW81_11255 [Gammaproteobacteria bacterium]|nr:hypothetical protein [Gammaproteobacteria bacterium]